MIITFNILEVGDSLSIALDKIVSFRDFYRENQPMCLEIDLVNGFTYRIMHHEEQLGCDIVNAITWGTIEGTVYCDDIPEVDSIRKIKTTSLES